MLKLPYLVILMNYSHYNHFSGSAILVHLFFVHFLTFSQQEIFQILFTPVSPALNRMKLNNYRSTYKRLNERIFKIWRSDAINYISALGFKHSGSSSMILNRPWACWAKNSAFFAPATPIAQERLLSTQIKEERERGRIGRRDEGKKGKGKNLSPDGQWCLLQPWICYWACGNKDPLSD